MPSRNVEKRSYDQLWTHRGNKFVIGTLHGNPIEIIAQYNPKELARQAAATWTPHDNTSARYAENGESQMWSEYKTTAPRTVTLELLFDGYEEGISVSPIVESLERLTIPVNMNSRDVTERRPQLCVAVWGTQQLRCVVQSVATKLTMFDESGEPLRASCTVVLTEVDVAAMMKVDAGAVKKISQKGGGYVHMPRDHKQSPYPPEDSKAPRIPRTSESTASDTSSASGLRSSPSKESAPAGTTTAPKSAAAPAPASTPAQPAPTPAPAASPVQVAPTSTASSPSAQPAPAERDETPDEVAADEKRAGEENDSDAAKYQHGTATQPYDRSTFADSPPPATSGQRDETPEEVAADEKRAGEENDADAAKYERGTASQPYDRSTFADSSPANSPAQPAPDAVSSADSGTADPKMKAAAEDME